MATKVLFIPVSSTKGIGEYMRSTIIARHLKACRPDLDIQFVLNEQVNYLNDCQFPFHTVPASPTRCTKDVITLLQDIKPDLVIFDASGRAEQFKAAKAIGAKVVFISQHSKKLAKGLALSRIKFIDEYWVAQPELTMSRLSWWQQAKLWLYKQSAPIYLGALFLPVTEQMITDVLSHLNLNTKPFALFSAGSGGHFFDEQPASDVFYNVATKIASSDLNAVVVFGPSYKGQIPESSANVMVLKSIDNQVFMPLMSASRFCVLSGGGSLIQALALGKSVITAPVAKDQLQRIAKCVAAGLISKPAVNRQQLLEQTEALTQLSLQPEFSARAENAPIENGVARAVQQINQLLNGQ